MEKERNKLVNDILFDNINEYTKEHCNEFGGGIVNNEDLKELLIDFWIELLQDKEVKDILIDSDYQWIEDIYEDVNEHFESRFYTRNEFEVLAYDTYITSSSEPEITKTTFLGLQWRIMLPDFKSEVVKIVSPIRLDKTLSENLEIIANQKLECIESEMAALESRKNNIKNSLDKFICQ